MLPTIDAPIPKAIATPSSFHTVASAMKLMVSAMIVAVPAGSGHHSSMTTRLNTVAIALRRDVVQKAPTAALCA